MSDSEENCGNCRFWAGDRLSEYGHCRVNPPIWSERTANRFPDSSPDAWCGRWESKIKYVAVVEPEPVKDQSTQERLRIIGYLQEQYRTYRHSAMTVGLTDANTVARHKAEVLSHMINALIQPGDEV
jgi:hypothetical protein